MTKLRTKLSLKQKVSQQKVSRLILSLFVLGILTTQINQDKGIELTEEAIDTESMAEVESSLGTDSEAEVQETAPQLKQQKTVIASSSKKQAKQQKSLGVSSLTSLKKTTSAANITQMQMNISGYTGKLAWASSYQRNIKKFIIERSIDDEEYQVLGQVDGQGVGEFTQENAYIFEDTSLMFVQMPRVFYRLKQVGTGGDNTYSDIIEQDLGLPIGFYASVDIDQNQEIHIKYAADKSGPIRYKILNAFGEAISSDQLDADFDPKTLEIDASAWEKGSYYLKLTDEKFSFMEAFYLE